MKRGPFIKKRAGFTLLEVVISVAALSLISVFILQMFMASSGLNERARNADIALAMAITEIDRVKSTEHIQTRTEFTYYDKNWNEINENSAKARYQFTISIYPSYREGLYEIAVEVHELVYGGNNYQLVTLQGKKYVQTAGR